jgi:GNAT superfamily N-acetyltransferase
VTEPAVKEICREQVDDAIALAGRAFAEDDVARYLFPEAARRDTGLRLYLGPFVRYGCLTRQGYSTAGAVHGMASWAMNGPNSISLGPMLRSGWLAAQIGLKLTEHMRLLTLSIVMNSLFMQTCRTNCCVLQLLAVDPLHQGRGLGGRLLAPVLQQADVEGRYCGLVTTSERAVRFYRRHGFAVAGDRVMPTGAVHLWAMQREPQRPPGAHPPI